MLTDSQINEIKEHLEKAQNPLFFFDNDNDGLTSFLILRRYMGRGKGVVIRSFPDLNFSYYRKVSELKPDYVFVLDKPLISKEFIEKLKRDNIPLVWIDHHQTEKPNGEWINYYNPYFNNKTYEPVSYICYNIVKRKEDIWLAIIGCISDCFIPDFYKEFQEKYPHLTKKDPKSAFDILYTTEIGKIAMILDFSLKDSITNVIKMIKFMINVKNPTEILEENSQTKHIHKRYNEINKKYMELIERAKKFVKKDLLYFQYGGNLSLSANLANHLSFLYPDKIIIVAYIKGDIANISLRGKGDIRKLTLEAIKDIEGATGGGHENATGAKMLVSDLPRFIKKIEELIEKK